MKITDVDAWEVLDSRGDPTVRTRIAVEVDSSKTATGTFTVPAGASTGEHEAVEVRDGGERYGGRGVRSAVRAVNEELGPAVGDVDPRKQAKIDATLVDVDGTDDLSRCGANAVLGVSGAVARAAAAALDRPLHDHVERLAHRLCPESASHDGERRASIPTPTINVISGGAHAPGGLAVQDVLAVPLGASSYPDALEAAWAVRLAARDRIEAAGHRPLLADEGGFAPPLPDAPAAFELVTGAITDAGYRPGEDVAIAVDVAATEFHADDGYRLGGTQLTTDAMVDRVAAWVDEWPIVSVEDPLAEDDWAGWCALAPQIRDGALLLGDDLLVTDRTRLDRAIDQGAVTAILVKPNQAGTITRTLEARLRAQQAGIEPVVSARSGETCDATIADLAVGLDAGQIKIGSLARSERLAKYNRLLEIDRKVALPFAGRTPYPDD